MTGFHESHRANFRIVMLWEWFQYHEHIPAVSDEIEEAKDTAIGGIGRTRAKAEATGRQ